VPKRNLDAPFLLYIKEGMTIPNVGTVITGNVFQGKVRAKDPVEIVGFGKTIKTYVKEVQIFHKAVEEAVAGDSIGLSLARVSLSDVRAGKVVAEPGSVEAHSIFEATIYLQKGIDLKKSEDEEESESGRQIRRGGRTTEFTSGYQPQFYFESAKVTGKIILPEGVKTAIPGAIIEKIRVEFDPDKSFVLKEGSNFSIRESDLTIGHGVVTKIIK